MSTINWSQMIARYHGQFLYDDDLARYSECWRLSLDDTAPRDPLSDCDQVLHEYDDDIVGAHYRWRQQLQQQRDVRELNSALAGDSQLVDRLKPFYFRRPVPLLRQSTWGASQHRLVVSLMRRWQVTGLPATASGSERCQLQQFNSLCAEMRDEQLEFLKFTAGVNAKLVAQYNTVGAATENYARKLFAVCRARIYHYPRYYTELKRLSLLPSARNCLPAAADEHLLIPTEQSIELGCVPFCAIPSMTSHVTLRHAIAKLNFSHPVEPVYPRCVNGRRLKVDGRYLYKHPVSMDANVARLCGSAPVDVALTPSVLKQLLAAACGHHADTWHVPVTVKQVQVEETAAAAAAPDGSGSGGDGGGGGGGGGAKRTRRVVMLDKPLAPGRVTTVAVNQRVLTRAARALFCRCHLQAVPDYSVWSDEKIAQFRAQKRRKTACGQSPGPRAVKSPQSPTGENTAAPVSDDNGEQTSDSEDEKLQIDDPIDSGEECETTAGVVSGATHSPSQQQQQQQLHSESSAVANDSENETVSQTGPVPVQSCQNTSQSHPVTSLPCAAAAAAAAAAGDTGEQGCDYLQPPPDHAVSYRLWRLAALHMLVRCNSQAMRASGATGGASRRLVRYTVHVKLCPMAAYGAQVMTGRELVDQWLDCRLRPGSRVLRVFVEPCSSRVLCVEQRTEAQLLAEFASYGTGLEPQRALAAVARLLTSLATLEPGAYLLCGGGGGGGGGGGEDGGGGQCGPGFARLLCAEGQPQAVGKTSWLDLRATELASGQLQIVPLAQSPPLPIDTSVLTPFHLKFGLVPGLFEHRGVRIKMSDARQQQATRAKATPSHTQCADNKNNNKSGQKQQQQRRPHHVASTVGATKTEQKKSKNSKKNMKKKLKKLKKKAQNTETSSIESHAM